MIASCNNDINNNYCKNDLLMSSVEGESCMDCDDNDGIHNNGCLSDMPFCSSYDAYTTIVVLSTVDVGSVGVGVVAGVGHGHGRVVDFDNTNGALLSLYFWGFVQLIIMIVAIYKICCEIPVFDNNSTNTMKKNDSDDNDNNDEYENDDEDEDNLHNDNNYNDYNLNIDNNINKNEASNYNTGSGSGSYSRKEVHCETDIMTTVSTGSSATNANNSPVDRTIEDHLYNHRTAVTTGICTSGIIRTSLSNYSNHPHNRNTRTSTGDINVLQPTTTK